MELHLFIHLGGVHLRHASWRHVYNVFQHSIDVRSPTTDRRPETRVSGCDTNERRVSYAGATSASSHSGSSLNSALGIVSLLQCSLYNHTTRSNSRQHSTGSHRNNVGEPLKDVVRGNTTRAFISR